MLDHEAIRARAHSDVSDDELLEHAREDISALLDENERLRWEVDRYRGLKDHWRNVAVHRQVKLGHMAAQIERVEAAVRLIEPDHITPQGSHILRKALVGEPDE